jgi:hypothetical protein
MLERFRRRTADTIDPAERGGTATEERPAEERQEGRTEEGERSAEERDRGGEGAEAPGGAAAGAAAARRDPDRAYDEFGGINWGSAFFGWLVALGMTSILVAIIGAAGAATGLTDDRSETVGIVGGALLLIAFLIAYFAGGYVAGRMSRFDGVRQGVGVWLIGLLITIILGILGAIFGSAANVLQRLDLPRIPIDEGALTTGGIIAVILILLGTLVAAAFGGRTGRGYHGKVDRAAGFRD